MKKKYKAAAVLTFCTLLAATCKEINMDGVKRAELNKAITVSVNEKAVYSENGLLFEISEIKDSRCPVNVNCIWAGNANIKITITGTNKEKTALELCIGQCDKQFQEADTVLFQQNERFYKLLLTKIDPYPGATDDGKKTATLILKKN